MPRFDCAQWRPISANTGGGLSPNLGLILHHQAGSGSLYSFFNNPAAKVSAHFWVSRGGAIEQYVDTSVVAWHGRDLNGRYVGVETEGCGSAPHAEAMPEAMVAALARLYAEGARRHGWKNALANSNGQAGFGYHRMAVNTACPCDVRLNRRSEILKRAFGGQASPQPPTPPSSGGSAPKMTVDWFGTTHNSRVGDVLTWQRKMRDRGWRIDTDQIYGPASETVCRQFQAEKRLQVDGKVGPQTWSMTWSAPVT